MRLCGWRVVRAGADDLGKGFYLIQRVRLFYTSIEAILRRVPNSCLILMSSVQVQVRDERKKYE